MKNKISDNHQLRKAKRGDEYAIIRLIKALAQYEKVPDGVINTPKQLAIDLFDDCVCDCFVYEIDKEIIGIALYYTSYSTWKGRCLYLEDIYIEPIHRRKGIGKIMFNKLIDEARKTGVKRMDWQVLEWNEPAIAFYKSIGASLDSEWINGRLFF